MINKHPEQNNGCHYLAKTYSQWNHSSIKHTQHTSFEDYLWQLLIYLILLHSSLSKHIYALCFVASADILILVDIFREGASNCLMKGLKRPITRCRSIKIKLQIVYVFLFPFVRGWGWFSVCDRLEQISKESIEDCRRYRADTIIKYYRLDISRLYVARQCAQSKNYNSQISFRICTPDSRLTLHTSPWRVSYEVSFVSLSMKNDRDISTAPYIGLALMCYYCDRFVWIYPQCLGNAVAIPFGVACIWVGGTNEVQPFIEKNACFIVFHLWLSNHGRWERCYIWDAGGRLNKKDGLTRYGNSHVKDKTS